MKLIRSALSLWLSVFAILGIGVIGTSRATAADLPVFTSRCIGSPVPYPIPKHPVVTFGDSITEGYGATNKCLPRELRSILPETAHRVSTGDTSYPGDLARLLHTTVLNYGVGGELTSDGLPRLQSMVRAVHPSVVVILEGINDLWGRRSVSDIIGNLSQTTRIVQAAGARPIIVTVLPLDRPLFPAAQTQVQVLDAAIRTMAHRQGATVVDAALTFQQHHPRAELFRHVDGREDGVHANDAGYALLAKMVAASRVVRSPMVNRHAVVTNEVSAG